MSAIEINKSFQDLAEQLDYSTPCEISTAEVEEVSGAGGFICLIQVIYTF
ncbi:hypothetical protein [Chromobacterium sp. IIBBL 290-4]|nr:hypothetical protein [Chromobacterium sp. IIBBL 290-4]UTH75618.1 hypothetical protein NKT35_05855 [Chromobacterium sp. IIBBL 290-4]